MCLGVLLDGFVLTSWNAVTHKYPKGSNTVIHYCCVFGKLCCWSTGMDHLPEGIHCTVSDSVSSVNEVESYIGNSACNHGAMCHHLEPGMLGGGEGGKGGE